MDFHLLPFLEGVEQGAAVLDELKFHILGIVPAFHQEDKFPGLEGVRFILGLVLFVEFSIYFKRHNPRY